MRESPHPVLLDISRTVARSRLPALTGIDRVERAYIRWAMQREVRFLAAFDGQQYLLDRNTVERLLDWLDAGGERPERDLAALLKPQRDGDLRAAQSLIRREALSTTRTDRLAALLQDHAQTGTVYLNVGHDNLTDPVIGAMRTAGINTVVLIHDTIPLDHPEYVRKGTPAKFQRKIAAALQADLLIANSQHTATRLRHRGAGQPVAVAPLGIDSLVKPTRARHQPGTFLCLGTIEPRKNHALLLEIWQRFWRNDPNRSPKLILLGRRGWENRQIFELLDTHPMVGKTVIEAGSPDDAELTTLLGTASVLLFPSHAEGYGLPLAEALDAGLPVVASDLPALREVGRDVPEYLPPTDAAAWEATIRDYAKTGSKRREAQLERMKTWEKPTWRAHFDIVENAMETILVQTGKDG